MTNPKNEAPVVKTINTDERKKKVALTVKWLSGLGISLLPDRLDTKAFPDNGFSPNSASRIPKTLSTWFDPKHGKHRGENIGMGCGGKSGNMVLDIDNKDKPGSVNGNETLARWMEEAGEELPKTLSSATPNGGKHYVFRWDPRLKNCTNSITGIDLLSGGPASNSIQALLPPSTFKGRPYKWIVPPEEIDEIPPMPEWLVQRLIDEGYGSAPNLNAGLVPRGDGAGNENVTDADVYLPLPKDQIIRMLQSVNPADLEEEDWMKFSMTYHYTCEHAELDTSVESDMFDYWDEWCMQDPAGYDEKENRSRWKSFSENGTVEGVLTTASFFRYARKEDWRPQEDDVLGANLRRTEKGTVKPTGHNLMLLMNCDEFRNQFDIVYDEFHGRQCVNGEPIQDMDYTLMYTFMSSTWSVEFAKTRIIDMVAVIAHKRKTHAFRKWLEALPKWDGKDRMPELLRLLTDDNPSGLYQKMVTKTLIAPVARAYNPGCMVRTLTILIGEQGIMKSSFWARLSPNRWYTDYCSFTNITGEHGQRELIKQSQGVVFAEVPEMRGMAQGNVDAVKHFLSATAANIVDKFEKHAVHMPRIGVFVGTSNPSELFRDDTGHSRFWPLQCRSLKPGEKIDVGYIESNLNQIWAQALHLYHSGEKWWLDDGKDEIALAEISRKHEVVFGPARWVFEMIDEEVFDGPFVTTSDVRAEAKDQSVKMPSVKEMEWAFHKAEWILNKKHDGKTWTMKVGKSDVESGSSTIMFGKSYEVGKTVRMPPGWVSPGVPVTLETPPAKALRAVWKAIQDHREAKNEPF